MTSGNGGKRTKTQELAEAKKKAAAAAARRRRAAVENK